MAKKRSTAGLVATIVGMVVAIFGMWLIWDKLCRLRYSVSLVLVGVLLLLCGVIACAKAAKASAELPAAPPAEPPAAPEPEEKPEP